MGVLASFSHSGHIFMYAPRAAFIFFILHAVGVLAAFSHSGHIFMYAPRAAFIFFILRVVGVLASFSHSGHILYVCSPSCLHLPPIHNAKYFENRFCGNTGNKGLILGKVFRCGYLAAEWRLGIITS